MVKIVIHNPKNKTDDPFPQDIYYMDSVSAKRFLDDNITKILSIEELD